MLIISSFAIIEIFIDFGRRFEYPRILCEGFPIFYISHLTFTFILSIFAGFALHLLGITILYYLPLLIFINNVDPFLYVLRFNNNYIAEFFITVLIKSIFIILIFYECSLVFSLLFSFFIRHVILFFIVLKKYHINLSITKIISLYSIYKEIRLSIFISMILSSITTRFPLIIASTLFHVNIFTWFSIFCLLNNFLSVLLSGFLNKYYIDLYNNIKSNIFKLLLSIIFAYLLFSLLVYFTFQYVDFSFIPISHSNVLLLKQNLNHFFGVSLCSLMQSLNQFLRIHQYKSYSVLNDNIYIILLLIIFSVCFSLTYSFLGFFILFWFFLEFLIFIFRVIKCLA